MSRKKEQSIKSAYTVMHQIKNGKWERIGDSSWSEVHLCSDFEDGSFRILAWSMATQEVLLNATVTSRCVYKRSNKPSFHVFKGDYGKKWGLGFHKCEESLAVAREFLGSVVSIIEQLKHADTKSIDVEKTQFYLAELGLINKLEFKSSAELRIFPPKPSKHKKHDTNIFDPKDVKHTTHIYFDADTQEFKGEMPDSFKIVLEKQFGVSPKQIPSKAVKGYDSKIPTILLDLKESLIEMGGYQVVGIFRLAPRGKNNIIVKDLINCGGDWKSQVDSVNICANLIKVWFRDLPVPILNQIEKRVIEKSQDVASVAKATELFPEPARSILFWLWDLCVEVAKHENVNKMGAKNLAIVIGPNLFDLEAFENPMLAMTFSGKVVTFCERGIEWRQSLVI